jgi:D-glucosaminate-6-phosphate ammonia-lyase
MNGEVMDRYRLRRVINAAGTMTSLGSSRVAPEAIEAAGAIQREFVRIEELQARASEAIALATGAEAGIVTACAASGIVVSVAAAMTGANLARIERLPDVSGLRHEVIVQAGHLINYGAPIGQAVRMSGATVVAAGTAAQVETFHIEDMIGARTVAGLFVVSHHVVQDGQTSLSTFIEICKAHDVPVIVDAASEYDLRGPISLGADLVIYSAHKFLGGPTAGIIAGRKALVRACFLQNSGIGRPMKVGKEGILGAIAALNRWARRDHVAAKAKEDSILNNWLRELSSVPGLTCQVHADWTGNPIDRLKVMVTPEDAGLYAWELADRLSAEDPAIYVRDDLVEHGYFFLDPGNLTAEEAMAVAAALRNILRAARQRGDGPGVSLHERRQRNLAARLRWPD